MNSIYAIYLSVAQTEQGKLLVHFSTELPGLSQIPVPNTTLFIQGESGAKPLSELPLFAIMASMIRQLPHLDQVPLLLTALITSDDAKVKEYYQLMEELAISGSLHDDDSDEYEAIYQEYQRIGQAAIDRLAFLEEFKNVRIN